MTVATASSVSVGNTVLSLTQTSLPVLQFVAAVFACISGLFAILIGAWKLKEIIKKDFFSK